MPLIVKCLTSCLYSISSIKAINNYSIKALIIYIDAARQRLIHYHKIIFQRHHTSSYNHIINAHLLFSHRLISIIRRMNFYRVETLLLSCRNNSFIRLNKWRVAPISLSWLRQKFMYMIKYISKIYVRGHTISGF